jgi:hypothetical protein
MTLTEHKRKTHPERYIRKDARCRIYRELYGINSEIKGKRSNVPALDETRRFHSFWSHQQAVQVYESNIDNAQLTSAQRAECEQRLDLLKRFKPHNVLD